MMHPHIKNDGIDLYLMTRKEMLLNEKQQIKNSMQGRIPFKKMYQKISWRMYNKSDFSE